MRWFAAALLAILIMLPQTLSAQPSDSDDGPIRAGDRFTFDSKDEITGEPRMTFTIVVTEVTDKEIVSTATQRGKTTSALIVFDHSLDTVDDSTWKYSPNNFQGVRLPLVVGKEWHFEYDSKNMRTGAMVRANGVSKVVAQETVTTAAGTFDTFKIEQHILTHSTTDPTNSAEAEIERWYAPKINFWVREKRSIRTEKRLRSSTSEELVDFHRKL
jgi:hypothetical protein